MTTPPGPSSPLRPSIPWSALPLRYKVYIIGFTLGLSAALCVGLIFLIEMWTPEPDAPEAAAAKQVERNIKTLEDAVRTGLRPNKDIQVESGRRYDGQYFVLAEYRPLIKEADMIEDSMMAAYKEIYTSGLPVGRAEIVAFADLVDGYGNKHEDPIYRSHMEGKRAELVQWDNLHNVQPRVAFSGSWRHALVR